MSGAKTPCSCSRCEEVISDRMERFGALRQIKGSITVVCQMLHSMIDHRFPELFELMSNPQKWIGEPTPPWFPVSSEKLKNAATFIDVVHAPLGRVPFVAASVKVKCDVCPQVTHVILLNVAALVLNTHLAAATPSSLPALRSLFNALTRDGLPPDDVPFPKPSSGVVDGIAWVLMHEYGHHFASDHPQRDAYSEKVAAELAADLMAFRVLQMRLEAQEPMARDRFTDLLLGIEGFLRTLSLVLSRVYGFSGKFEEMPDVLDGDIPSPRLRLENLLRFVDVGSAVGLGGVESLNVKRQSRFGTWETLICQI